MKARIDAESDSLSNGRVAAPPPKPGVSEEQKKKYNALSKMINAQSRKNNSEGKEPAKTEAKP